MLQVHEALLDTRFTPSQQHYALRYLLLEEFEVVELTDGIETAKVSADTTNRIVCEGNVNSTEVLHNGSNINSTKVLYNRSNVNST